MKCYNYFPFLKAKELIKKKKMSEAYNILCQLYDDEKNSVIIKNELLEVLSELKKEAAMEISNNYAELLEEDNNIKTVKN